MPEDPTEVEIVDLTETLEGFEPPERSAALVKALEATLKAIMPNQSAEDIEDHMLERVDHTAVTRQTYILSALRFLGYLKSVQEGGGAVVQAKLALSYIKHCENSGLRNLQLGRAMKDSKLEEEVSSLRSEVNEIANYRAEAIRVEEARESRRAAEDPKGVNGEESESKDVN